MTRSFAQNASNDIFLDGDGQIAVSSGKDAYADIIADTVRTMKGEVVFARDNGVDYFNTVFQSVSKLNIWKHQVEEAVLALDFVKGIVSFDANYKLSTKTMTYTLTVETDEGSLTVSN